MRLVVVESKLFLTEHVVQPFEVLVRGLPCIRSFLRAGQEPQARTPSDVRIWCVQRCSVYIEA